MVALLIAPSALEAQGPLPLAPASDDPFARRGWYLELGGQGATETWNYNISHEDVYGFVTGMTYGLRDGVVLTASWPLYYVSQRGPDGWLLAATTGVRARVYRRPRFSLFAELMIGVSKADTFVPPRGTRFNYLGIGGGGVTLILRPGVHLLGGLRLVHVSNNGLAGPNRNPDIEAIGPHAGVLIGF